MSNLHPGRVIPQDIAPQDGWGDMLTALPVSQAEIDDLLYGEDRSAGDRVARLSEIAEFLREREPGDFGDNDPGILLGAIEDAIARLEGNIDPDTDAAPMRDDDPLGHRETLSPDSDELAMLEAADAASLSEGEPRDDSALDPAEWSEDDLATDRGVQ